MPSIEEMNQAIESLDQANWHVDYVLTHCTPNSIQRKIQEHYEFDPLTSFLEHVKSELKFKKWFFEHYHEDLDINPNLQALYHRIIEI